MVNWVVSWATLRSRIALSEAVVATSWIAASLADSLSATICAPSSARLPPTVSIAASTRYSLPVVTVSLGSTRTPAMPRSFCETPAALIVTMSPSLRPRLICSPLAGRLARSPGRCR